MTTLAAALLTSTLWAASQAERQAPPSAFMPVLAPIESIADDVAIDLVFLGFGAGGDLITTSRGIRRGCVEGNKYGPDMEARVGLKFGTAALRASSTYLLRRVGKKKLADFGRYLGAAYDVYAMVHNEMTNCGSK